MAEMLPNLELELSKEFPNGPTEKEIDEFCKKRQYLRCSKRKKEFIDYIFRKG